MEEPKLKIVDKDHLYYGGVQYISLQRLLELEDDKHKEIKILQDDVSRLEEENEAYKILLKTKLEKEN